MHIFEKRRMVVDTTMEIDRTLNISGEVEISEHGSLVIEIR